LAPGVNRFIPAPAGNTRPTGGCPARSTVHPRACGEHRYSAGMVGSLAGSSPRLRGTRQRICAKHDCVAVHPRACGEHKRTGKPMKLYAGSSPRLRGTRGHEYAEQRLRRFIPAPAGNTPGQAPAPTQPPVHPRACGEHAQHAMGQAVAAGSSPRLRGTPAQGEIDLVYSRFIPAPAGNTCHINRDPPPDAVHPRACGEHSLRISLH